MTDQLSLLPLLDDSAHPTWLLSGKPGIQNDSGVYVDNVFRFREGKLSGVNGVRRWTGLRSFSTCLVSVDFKLVTSPSIKDGKVLTEKT